MQQHTPNNQPKLKLSKASSDAGFTLLETAIALVILTIGLVALAGSISYAMVARNQSRNVMDAKIMIVTALEQIETLRNTKQLTYGQIANEGEVDNTGGIITFGGFPSAFRDIPLNPGTDGIYGTTDDTGTGARTGFKRKVVITALPAGTALDKANLKKIEVTVQYPGQNGVTQELVGVGYLNNDAHGNYIK